MESQHMAADNLPLGIFKMDMRLVGSVSFLRYQVTRFKFWCYGINVQVTTCMWNCAVDIHKYYWSNYS